MSSIIVSIASLIACDFARSSLAYFGILATLKERSHADKADIIIPHDGILGIIPWDFEDVLKDCMGF